MNPKETHAVLIHGWGSSARTWQTVSWPQAWHVHAYELPGHGARNEEGPWSIPFAAQDLLGFLREVLPQGARAILVGHSMGGQVSMLVHAQHPELVSGEVVIDPAYNGGDSAAQIAETRRTLASLRRDPHGTMTQFARSAFSGYLGAQQRRTILDDVLRTNATALSDYFKSEYLGHDSFGLHRDTLRVARHRTRPVLGFYPSAQRGDLELAANPERLDVQVSVWGTDHGHFMHVEDPVRFSSETVTWAIRRGLATSQDELAAPSRPLDVHA